MNRGFALAGKSAVVTGAGSGIGLALAHALAKRGCRVVAVDIDVERASMVVDALRSGGATAVACQADVSRHDEVARVADLADREMGHTDILFNNAGVSGGGQLLDAHPSDLAWIMGVNVGGVWNGCSVFGKRMRQRGEPAWIVNTASEHALGFQHAGEGFYTASKNAVLGLSDVLRRELPAFIGLSVLCPGLVQSDMWRAQTQRPSGTPVSDKSLRVSQGVMAKGMPAERVAHAALAAVERGDYVIVTHSNSRAAADLRWKEIDAAFAAQCPATDDADRYDVNRVVTEVITELRGRR